MKQLSKAAKRLLRSEFTRDGMVVSAGVATCGGDCLLWNELVHAGLVTRGTPSLMGHPFCFNITEIGQRIAATKTPKLKLGTRYDRL